MLGSAGIEYDESRCLDHGLELSKVSCCHGKVTQEKCVRLRWRELERMKNLASAVRSGGRSCTSLVMSAMAFIGAILHLSADEVSSI
jgi:hypothetical protein